MNRIIALATLAVLTLTVAVPTGRAYATGYEACTAGWIQGGASSPDYSGHNVRPNGALVDCVAATTTTAKATTATTALITTTTKVTTTTTTAAPTTTAKVTTTTAAPTSPLPCFDLDAYWQMCNGAILTRPTPATLPVCPDTFVGSPEMRFCVGGNVLPRPTNPPAPALLTQIAVQPLPVVGLPATGRASGRFAVVAMFLTLFGSALVILDRKRVRRG
jgi:hypothetical protein